MELAAHLRQTFVTLYDAVEKAIGNTTEFKSFLLRNIKSTLDSLEPWIKQRGVCKLLQNRQLIENLIVQMHKGVELVHKFSKSSKLNVWKNRFIKDDADQLVELDRYLGRMMGFLGRHEEGREIEELFRELKYVASKVKRRLSVAVAETLEKPLFSSSTAESHQSEEQLVTKFHRLLDLVTAEENSTTARFKPFFGDLKSTLKDLKPFADNIEQLNLPEDEVEDIIALVDKCFELVLSSPSVVLQGSYNKKYVYMNQLLELNHSLQRQLSMLREQMSSYLNKELVSARTIEVWLSELVTNTLAVPKEQTRHPINETVILTQCKERK